ncbi:MAG TPA: Dabb family protein [Microbacterium sp.]|nr:Dabb family protein [Microbacterium sp.]
MILHLAFFRFKEEVSAADVAELTQRLKEMAAQLPMLRSYECGENLRVRPSDLDYAVAAVVDDAPALEAYLDSDVHKAVYDQILGRMVDTRAAAQLEVESWG